MQLPSDFAQHVHELVFRHQRKFPDGLARHPGLETTPGEQETQIAPIEVKELEKQVPDHQLSEAFSKIQGITQENILLCCKTCCSSGHSTESQLYFTGAHLKKIKE